MNVISLNQFFIWQNLLFVFAYSLSLIQYHLRSRRRMLATKSTSDYTYAVYYFTMHGISGGIGAAIAATGSMVQALTPDRWMKRTKYYRVGGAIALAGLGIAFSSHKLSDVLPLLAVIAARFFEISSSPQKVRYGLWLTFTPWMIYNGMHGLYLMLFANCSVFISLTWAIFKHRRIKLVPEAI